jgi:hypothetical protein
MKILTICPSRERPKQALEMINSFKETSTEDNKLVLFLDDDDPTIDDYLKIELSNKIFFSIGERLSTTKLINFGYKSFHNCGYFHITNDDFIYKTEGWDSIFVKKLEETGYGICYGNDLLQKERMPTAPFISGNLVRALDWLQLPTLEHLGNDCVWMEIGKKLNALFYFEDIIIEHRHYQANKSLIDNTYRRTNSVLMYDRDSKAFRTWRSTEFDKQIETIRLAVSS